MFLSLTRLIWKDKTVLWLRHSRIHYANGAVQASMIPSSKGTFLVLSLSVDIQISLWWHIEIIEEVSYHQPLPVSVSTHHLSVALSRGQERGSNQDTNEGGERREEKGEEKKIWGEGWWQRQMSLGITFPPSFFPSFPGGVLLLHSAAGRHPLYLHLQHEELTENHWRQTFLSLGLYALHQSFSSKSLLPISNHTYLFNLCRSECSVNKSLK